MTVAPAPVLPPGAFVALPGRGEVFVREITGPPSAVPVVLVHGWSASADINWFSVFEALGEVHRVVAVDLRGHGHDARSVLRLRLADCAADVAAVIEVLGLDRPIVVGYSMGGMVAQLVWRRHPHLVGGLVLCATAACPPLPAALRWWYQTATLGAAAVAFLLPRRCQQALIEAVRWVALGPPVARCGTPFDRWLQQEKRRGKPRIDLAAAGASVAYDSRLWIGEVDVPSAVVVPIGDGVIDPEAQLALVRAIPGASVHRVAGDHRVCLTDPVAFAASVAEACREVSTRRGPERHPAEP